MGEVGCGVAGWGGVGIGGGESATPSHQICDIQEMCE